MSDDLAHAPLMDSEVLAQWIVDHGYIWQLQFLNAKKLATYCRDRGTQISSVSGAEVELLWRLGLLRADYVKSPRELDRAGLIELRSDATGFTYADARLPDSRPEGWLGCARKEDDVDDIDLYFHPFRFYVVQYLLHPVGPPSLQPNIRPTSMFTTSGIGSYTDLTVLLLERFNRYSQSPHFLRRVMHLSDLATLTVATEPCVFERMFGTQIIRGLYPDELGISVEEFWQLSEDDRFDMGFELQQDRIATQSEYLTHQYRRIGLERLKELHQALCIDAERLHSDKDVLTLLRLARGRKPTEIRDRVGAALQIRIMAEVIRRFTESTFDILLPEEDEAGFGFTPAGVKKARYGSDRILDGDRSAANAFVRVAGLDYGTRVRLYVEGYTEWGALGAIFGRYGGTGVEVHNLRARVVSKGKAGFESNLRTDLEGRVFSLVMVDGDRSDYVAVLRRAAEDDAICGGFFLQYPDFEFANFTLEEMEVVLWEHAESRGALPDERATLHAAINGATNAKDLEHRAKRALTASLATFRRNQDWGERLMQLAWDQSRLATGETRPVIEAVEVAHRLVQADFQFARDREKVDPSTGRMVER